MGLRVATEATMHLILLFLVLAQPSYSLTSTQKETIQTQAQITKSGIQSQGDKFGFRIVTVESERPPSTMYRVEGLTEDKERLILSCHSVPPPLPGLGGRTGTHRERLVRWFDQYGGIEKFRKAATENVYLGSEVKKYVILLYSRGREEVRDSIVPPEEIVDQCVMLKRIANAAGNGH
jgi:hypothetical protein